MRKSDFRNPLLQSGVFLFILLVFFSFVATSDADSFGSGLLAIISGIFHSALFFIGLFFSILISIVLLITLFLAAIAFYSFEKAKELWIQLQSTLLHIFMAVNDHITQKKIGSLETFRSQTAKIQKIEKELDDFKNENLKLQHIVDSQEKRYEELQALVASQCPDAPVLPDTSTKES